MTDAEGTPGPPVRRTRGALGRVRRTALTRLGARRAAPVEESRQPGGGAVLGPAGARCLVLADPDRPRRTQRWLRESRADQVLVLVPGATDWRPESDSVSVRQVHGLDELLLEVRKLGRVDVILSLLPKEHLPEGVPDQYDLFTRLFLYLRPGGTFVFDRTVEGADRSPMGPARWRRLLGTPDRAEASGRDVGFARAVGTLVVSRGLVVVTKRGRHHLKLRGDELDEVLPTRDPATAATLLATLPGGSFESHGTSVAYGPSAGEPMPERMDYPAMSLRHYTGRLASAGGMRLFTPNTILPDSFRWYFSPLGVGSPRIDSVGHDMALIPRRQVPRRRLDGDYYNLDCLYDGHFGHLTTEVVSRLWGWERAKREIPDLKAFFHVRPKRNNDPTLERALFTAFGIAEEDLVWVEGPVKLRSLVSATPMWQNQHPHFAHPDIRGVWERLTAGLLDGAGPAGHQRIFVSRGPGLSHRRHCRNQADVERFFADRGFHVFYPEQLPLAEQVALFAGARVVAGFAGSAMFNLMHTERLEALIVLGHNAYPARNEHLYTAVLGGEMHYFWSAADVPPPATGRSLESVRSSWQFDFAEHGAELERVVAAH
jgi:capsular polysaccharide biosynthesis protein